MKAGFEGVAAASAPDRIEDLESAACRLNLPATVYRRPGLGAPPEAIEDVGQNEVAQRSAVNLRILGEPLAYQILGPPEIARAR